MFGTDNAIELDALTIRTSGRTLLSSITLKISNGSRVVVLGPNGAGKTTLFRVLGASLRPTSGVARILGYELGKVDLRELRKHIGVGGSASIDSLNRSMTVLETVLTGIDQVSAHYWLKPTSEQTKRALRLIAVAGLSKSIERQLGELSMGERQQIGIARALMPNPALLLLDEPTAGLDLGAREKFIERIDYLVNDNPCTTTVLVTHHLEEIPPSFHRLVALGENGHLLADGEIKKELTSDLITKLFNHPLEVSQTGNRFNAFGIRDIGLKEKKNPS